LVKPGLLAFVLELPVAPVELPPVVLVPPPELLLAPSSLPSLLLVVPASVIELLVAPASPPVSLLPVLLPPRVLALVVPLFPVVLLLLVDCAPDDVPSEGDDEQPTTTTANPNHPRAFIRSILRGRRDDTTDTFPGRTLAHIRAHAETVGGIHHRAFARAPVLATAIDKRADSPIGC
jgi:hypothetical protein